MKYWQFTGTVARNGYRNLVGLIVISLLAGLAVLPISMTVVLGTPLALLGGLWTTCLLLGIVTIAAFSLTTAIAERGVPIAVRPHTLPAIQRPYLGIAVGIVSFCIVIIAIALITVVPSFIRPMTAGVAGFLLITWSLLVAFAAPELGNDRRLSVALWASADRLSRSPIRIVWFCTLSVVCTLIAGITVITLLLFLPGVLALLAAHVALDADSDQ